ncbi:MAG TPA: hypothetical protein VMW31_03170 [Devosiaceae bacterium]|nr:hypothetical protein [Devosiaceae bacterium]
MWREFVNRLRPGSRRGRSGPRFGCHKLALIRVATINPAAETGGRKGRHAGGFLCPRRNSHRRQQVIFWPALQQADRHVEFRYFEFQEPPSGDGR